MMSKHTYRSLYICLLVLASGFYSCDTIDLYEKVDSIPSQEWQTGYKPKFEFDIKDTTSDYQLYITLRHNEKYNYNNIWVNLYATAPGGTTEKFLIELPLATPSRGWLGTGMDDLYDHRIPIILDPRKLNFKKAGPYQFQLEHIMREDPLQNIMNVGLRLEKKES